MKIRLIHITTVPESLEFFRGQIGYLKARGFDIHLISSPGPRGHQIAQAESVSFYDVPIKREMSPISDLRSIWRLFLLIKNLKPDIVHSHTPKAGLLGTLAARAAGVPVVYLSVFGLPQMTLAGFRRGLLDFLTRLTCRIADRVWCDSFSVRNHLEERNLCSSARAHVIAQGSSKGVNADTVFSPHIYDSASQVQIRRELSIPGESLIIGFVGRIVQDKGVRELADAWRYLSPKRKDLHMILIGPYEKKDSIRPEDDSLFRGDPRIHLLGHRSNVAQYMAVMDVFVLPSYREGLPLVNLEAAAMGKPVVTTNVVGCSDSVIDGETGTLVPPYDVDRLVGAIEAYLDDPGLRREHGKRGRIRILDQFRPEDIWQGLYESYVDLIKKRDC